MGIIPAALVDRSRRHQARLHPSGGVWEIDAEGALAGVGGARILVLVVVLALQQTQELLTLHFVFGEEVVGFAVGAVAMHAVGFADNVNLAEGEEGEGEVGG